MTSPTTEIAVKRVRWIERAGRKILFTDFSHLRTEHEMLEILREWMRVEKQHPGVLVFVDVENALITTKVMEETKAYGKEYRIKAKMKTAIIGITGLRVVFLNSYLRFTRDKIKIFRTKEEAVKWLVSSPAGHSEQADG